MRIIYNRWLPFRGFKAVNCFGILLVRHGEILDTTLLNHERIHTAQMKELWYVGFYLCYFIEWMIRLCQKRNLWRAYLSISFEREAYTHERDVEYIKRRKPFAFWHNRTI